MVETLLVLFQNETRPSFLSDVHHVYYFVPFMTVLRTFYLYYSFTVQYLSGSLHATSKVRLETIPFTGEKGHGQSKSRGRDLQRDVKLLVQLLVVNQAEVEKRHS